MKIGIKIRFGKSIKKYYARIIIIIILIPVLQYFQHDVFEGTYQLVECG